MYQRVEEVFSEDEEAVIEDPNLSARYYRFIFTVCDKLNIVLKTSIYNNQIY